MTCQTFNLLDVCDFKGGTQPPKSTFSLAKKQGYVRLLQIQDFSTDEYQVFVPHCANLSMCTENDILIGRYGASVGKVCRGKAGAHNVALVKVIVDASVIVADYLYYFFNSSVFQSRVLQQSRRAAQAGFSKSGLEDFKINLPLKEIQSEIAQRLTDQMALIDEARLSLDAQWNELISLEASIINESLLGTCSTTKSIGDVLDEVKIGIGKNWASYPVMGATRNGLAPAIAVPGKNPQRYKPVVPGTVFYNPMRILIGSIAFVDDDDTPGITSPDYVVLKGKPGVTDSRWFYHWLRSPLGEQCISSLARGAVRERMLFNRLAEGEIKLPAFPAQERASKALAAIKPMRTALAKQLKELELMPKKLLAQVFEG